jgi:hypothetical protein
MMRADIPAVSCYSGLVLTRRGSHRKDLVADSASPKNTTEGKDHPTGGTPNARWRERTILYIAPSESEKLYSQNLLIIQRRPLHARGCLYSIFSRDHSTRDGESSYA